MILGTKSILQAIRGSKLVDFNDTIITDHHGFIFDINFKEYFHLQSSRYEQSETRKLNPNNRKHRIKFKDKLEEYIDQLGLVEKAE